MIGRRRRWTIDVAVAVLVLAASTVIVLSREQRVPVPGLILAAGACGAVLGRRRWPTVSFLASTVLAESALAVWGDDAAVLLLAAPLLCVYAVADSAGWRRASVAGGAALLVLVALHAVWQPAWATAQNVALLGFGGFAVAAGEAVRNRRAQAASLVERARAAELEAERQSARQVLGERLRIARDLHDVLGHQLALISVHAGAAADLVGSRPDQAVQSLRHIKDASRAALTDLRDVVVLLRTPGEPADASAATAGLDLTAGVDRLDALLAVFRGSGLAVEVVVEGEPRLLAADADLAVYRVVQEALTNVVKHTEGGDAHVLVRYGADDLRVVVEDDGPFIGRVSEDGQGLRGMQERVALAGGRCRAEPRPDGGFVVDVRLPAGRPQDPATTADEQPQRTARP